jgi:hypothetical protein
MGGFIDVRLTSASEAAVRRLVSGRAPVLGQHQSGETKSHGRKSAERVDHRAHRR